MKVIGVTGPIGSGKSTVAKILKEKYDAFVIDADQVAREIVEVGSDAYNEIIEAFGKEVLFSDGTLNRKKLGEKVFGNEENLKIINKITHPRIIKEIRKRIDALEKTTDLLVIEASIPIREGFLDIADQVWTVITNKDLRIKRVMDRNKLSQEDVLRRIRAQERLNYKDADCIIYNNGTLEELEKMIEGTFKYENYSIET